MYTVRNLLLLLLLLLLEWDRVLQDLYKAGPETGAGTSRSCCLLLLLLLSGTGSSRVLYRAGPRIGTSKDQEPKTKAYLARPRRTTS
jgi:hypothetical protein